VTVLKMWSTILFVVFAVTLQHTSATIYFKDYFESNDWEQNWVQSKYANKEYGKFEWTAGKFYGDADEDKGLKTTQDAHFYAISRKFEPFSNEGKDLVIQFTVKHEQNIDCGGGYLKIFDCGLDQPTLHGESPYKIMFGPDICGPGTKKVHVIFNYKGQNLLVNKDIKCKDDVYTHVYRLSIKPDNTYKVYIDGEVVEKGDLETDWNFLAPKKVKDPNAKKPEDWDDRAKIPDPNDKKPEDWDQPEYIPDPAATKPEDWDDEMDGEWEPPQINNPAFKGEWKPKEIDNPDYKGAWVHPEIDNPEYVPDDKLYHHKEICAVGLDLWQVKAGTIFDNILIGDSEEEADAEASKIMERVKEEKKVKEKLDEEEKKSSEAAEEAKKDAEVDKEEDDIEDDKDEEKDEDKDKHEEL